MGIREVVEEQNCAEEKNSEQEEEEEEEMDEDKEEKEEERMEEDKEEEEEEEMEEKSEQGKDFRRNEGDDDLENLEVDQVASCLEITDNFISNNEEYHTEIADIQKDIIQTRKEARANLEKQSKRMIRTRNKKLIELKVGDNVLIPIPKIDRGHFDLKNLLGVIIDIEHGKYRVGLKIGVIKHLLDRNQINFCPMRKLCLSEIDDNKKLSIREAVKEAGGDGQGIPKCFCKTGCERQSCKCKKNNLKCTTRCNCHKSAKCKNF